MILPGTLPYSVGYYLDGIPIRGPREGELALNISIAAIDEFKVQESFLLPDQGLNAAAVNVATKSGGNQFHGEAFEFLRNNALDARGFFATSAENLKQNQFGFALGGPFRRNRAWFYGFYEGLRQVSAFSAAGFSPTAVMFSGNLAGTGQIIYDPATYSPSTGQRLPFSGNVIPAQRINPVSNRLLQYYLPGSNLASRPSDLFGNPRDTFDDNQGGLRADAAITNRQQLFGEAFRQSSPVVQPGLYPLSGLLYANRSDLLILAHIWQVSPLVVNTLRLSFRYSVATGGNQAQTPLLNSIGITNALDNQGVTAINLQGYSSFGRSNGEVGNRDDNWHVGEECNYLRGDHSFAFGAILNYRRGWDLNANSNALGTLNFQSLFTAQLTHDTNGQPVPQPNTGNAWADFLLGLPANGTLSGLPEVQYLATQFQAFVQDTWKVTPSLTLNYGFSWFVETPPNPQGWARNATHGFDLTTGLLTLAALGQMNPKGSATDWNNFAPRAGIVWNPRSLKTTVFRAGAGTYYSEFPWVASEFSLLFGSPIGPGQGFTNLQSGPIPKYQLGKNVFPPLSAPPLNANYAANLPSGTLVSAIDPNLRTAYVNQWNASIQQMLSRSDLFEVSYLGSSAHRLIGYSDFNQCRPTSGLYCNPATRPWPRYGALVWLAGSGNSSYEALIAKYRHRTNQGLDLLFQYTLSKVLTDAWQSTLLPNGQIAACRACDKGPATFDVPQRAVASAVWELPFGRGQRFGANIPRAGNIVAGNWRITSIVTMTAGQPVALTAPNTTSSLYLNPLPNRICNGNSAAFSDHVRSNRLLWFDSSCFVLPASGYFGNSGRTVLHGPGFDNWDIGFEKAFSFVARESSRVLFRAELFNAWNHTQLEPPNGDGGAGVNFGRISAARPPRLIQFGIKLQL